jgi:transposase
MRQRLVRALGDLASARSSVDAHRVFEARWQANLCIGSLYEAARATRARQDAHVDACVEY